MRLYLTTKKIFSFEKEGIEQFLNGLTANDMRAPQNAFLNIHGRIVATFAQMRKGSQQYYLLFEEARVVPAMAHLDRYLKLGGIKVQPVDKRVYHDLSGEYAPGPEDDVIPWPAGQLVLTAKELDATVSTEEYTQFRLTHRLPLQGVDYDEEMVLNVSSRDYVSFTKGCFLGQEPVSKVYNRSRPTWRLVVKALEDCSPEEARKMTSPLLNPADAKTYGFVFEKNE